MTSRAWKRDTMALPDLARVPAIRRNHDSGFPEDPRRPPQRGVEIPTERWSDAQRHTAARTGG